MRRSGRLPLAMLLLGTLVCAQASALQNVREVDAARSRAQFWLRNFGFGHVSGTIPIRSGRVVLGNGSALPLSLEGKADPNGVDTANAKRDRDLRGADWFDVARYPQWTYKSAKITKMGATGFRVEGTLTVHGKSAPVGLDGVIVSGLPHPRYRATGHVDRHVFGMRGSSLAGFAGSDVTISLSVVLH